MKKMRILAIAMATMLTFGFVSCGDEEDTNFDGYVLEENGTPLEIRGLGFCDTACYPLHFEIMLRNNHLVMVNDTAMIIDSVRQAHAPSFPDPIGGCWSAAKIHDNGKVKGLYEIKGTPNDLYDSLPAVSEHGYIIEAHGTLDIHIPGMYVPTKQYMRLWIEGSTDNGGYKVRYEFPFDPSNED